MSYGRSAVVAAGDSKQLNVSAGILFFSGCRRCSNFCGVAICAEPRWDRWVRLPPYERPHGRENPALFGLVIRGVWREFGEEPTMQPPQAVIWNGRQKVMQGVIAEAGRRREN